MPASSRDHAPLFSIRIDGQDLDPVEADFVHEIKITNWLRMPDVCTLQVGYPAKSIGEPYESLDKSKLEIGRELEVRMGSMDESTTQTLFKGEIVTVEPDFHAGGVAMVVRAYDRTHRMMRTRKQRSFIQQKSSDIIKKVCSEHGIRANVTASSDVHQFILQHNETDFDFVLRLARRIGFELTVDAGNAKFAPPNANGEKVELTYPDELRAFRPRITAVQQVQTVNVRGFDFQNKRSVVRTKTRPQQITAAGISRSTVANKFPQAVLEIAGQSFTTTGEADSMAQAALDQLANAYLAAEGTCDGDPRIKAGVLLQISGVGKNYSGTYRVAKSVHVIRGGGGYETQWSNSVGEHSLLGQSAGGKTGSGLAINSIVVGVVTNNNDPETLGRVKVSLPSLSDVESFWAPVGVPAGGSERGISMLPMPGDQVIVAFENGDPSFPYVIGSVFNGKDKPGKELALTDGSFALRSDHKANLHTKEDITVQVDKGKLDIKVDNGDITETVKGSGGGYTGDFAGAYKLKATQAVTIESSQSVTIKAPSITVDASASLTLKGAMIDIKASGIVTIGGSMINIG
jgi:phage protein D/phage baseplate assembly protein gpV